jgi:Zn-dependent protease with chaperone function
VLVLAVFFSFVAWRGGKIQIPGTGASITDIPAFLEISLAVAAFSLMWLPYIFLSNWTSRRRPGSAGKRSVRIGDSKRRPPPPDQEEPAPLAFRYI